MSKTRLPPVPAQAYSVDQKAAEQDFVATRKVGFTGPWNVFIRSPELLTHAQRMGEYLRYRCTIAGRLSELTILLVARHWTQDYEWGAHRNHAVKAGVSEEVVEAIRVGRRPSHMSEDESIVHEFVSEILHNRSVSDPTYAAALGRFGEQGVIDICGIVGYYQLLALTMNVARVEPPKGETPLPRFPFEP